jgi:O-antigen ligase
MVLQLAGLSIIAWTFLDRRRPELPNSARGLIWIAALAVVWTALQLVPLPPAVWTHLGGRQFIADGFRDLGIPLPWLPVSLAPYQTINALLGAIPPMAVLLGLLRARGKQEAVAALAILAATIAGIGLSALQLSSGGGSSPFYLYPETNFGAGVGFFANANHMASLLLVAIPFLAALMASTRKLNIERYTAAMAVAIAAALLILVGLALNGSLAGYGLIIPVCLASGAIVLPAKNRFRRWGALLSIVFAVAAVGAIATKTIATSAIAAESDTSVQSRLEILRPTVALAVEFAPVGSGVGTFRALYPTSEDPARVTKTYVIHAHNELAEWVLETGLPGLLIILALLIWWVSRSVVAWRLGDGGSFARAASVASGALLLHSLVDFPLRTSALAAVFALCLALLADRRSSPPKEANDLRPTRHILIR